MAGENHYSVQLVRYFVCPLFGARAPFWARVSILARVSLLARMSLLACVSLFTLVILTRVFAKFIVVKSTKCSNWTNVQKTDTDIIYFNFAEVESRISYLSSKSFAGIK